jgi:hypothetical protein
MTNEMQLCRETDDYTEIDLFKWTEQLKELRKLFETQLNIEIVEDENISTVIQMIKVREQPLPHLSSVSNQRSAENNHIICVETPVLTHEKFHHFLGRVALSEDGLLATCLGTYWDGSNVYGTRLYSSGRHEIHFRIENKGSNNLFFGINTTSYDMPLQTLTSSYVYGWWEFDQAIESVSGHRVHTDRNIRAGDDVTMILDCDDRQIRLGHHRMNMITHIPVELEKCPFPWKILVTLRSPGDSIRILL